MGWRVLRYHETVGASCGRQREPAHVPKGVLSLAISELSQGENPEGSERLAGGFASATPPVGHVRNMSTLEGCYNRLIAHRIDLCTLYIPNAILAPHSGCELHRVFHRWYRPAASTTG